MCVISLAEAARPDRAVVEEMYESNPKGAGVAWRENGRVRWEKGLSLEAVQERAAEVPLPFALHFRTPSFGTSMSMYACHPFPISDDVDTSLSGSVEGWVLFHNGFWHDWRSKLIDIAVKSGKKLPPHSWSDSRGLAWAAHHFGIGILELIDEKVLLFGPNPEDIKLLGYGWTTVDVGGGDMWVSNTQWVRKVQQGYHTTAPASIMGPPNNKQIPFKNKHIGGYADKSPFQEVRGDHSRARCETGNGGNQQESLQKGSQERVSGAEAMQESIDMLNWVRGKNPSATKLTVCSLCHVENRSVFTDDNGYKWYCQTCYRARKAVVEDVYQCRICLKFYNIKDLKYVDLSYDSVGCIMLQCNTCTHDGPDNIEEEGKKRVERKAIGIDTVGPI